MPSHRSVAVCNDCHVPEDALGKYATKARNGFWHSFYFTTQTFHEPIRATPPSRDVAEANCRRCHEAVALGLNAHAHRGKAGLSCIRCHSSVGHLELGATSLASQTR
jgi:cytochrome c nitrite reductase small subunit